MGLADRLSPKQNGVPTAAAEAPASHAPVRQPAGTPPPRNAPSASTSAYKDPFDTDELSGRFHKLVLERLDLTIVAQLGPDELRKRLRTYLDQFAVGERAMLSEAE